LSTGPISLPSRVNTNATSAAAAAVSISATSHSDRPASVAIM